MFNPLCAKSEELENESFHQRLHMRSDADSWFLSLDNRDHEDDR